MHPALCRTNLQYTKLHKCNVFAIHLTFPRVNFGGGLTALTISFFDFPFKYNLEGGGMNK